MSTTVFQHDVERSTRAATARPSAPSYIKGEPGPRGGVGPKGAPGPRGRTGAQGPRGPGAGKPNAVVRAEIDLLSKDKRPYMAGFRVLRVESLDPDKDWAIEDLFEKDAYPEGESVRLKAQGYLRVYLLGGPFWMDVTLVPSDPFARLDLTGRKPGATPVLLEYFAPEGEKKGKRGKKK